MEMERDDRIFQSNVRSERDLPLRLCECGMVYRYEQSGELCGLRRVRALTGYGLSWTIATTGWRPRCGAPRPSVCLTRWWSASVKRSGARSVCGCVAVPARRLGHLR